MKKTACQISKECGMMLFNSGNINNLIDLATKSQPGQFGVLFHHEPQIVYLHWLGYVRPVKGTEDGLMKFHKWLISKGLGQYLKNNH